MRLNYVIDEKLCGLYQNIKTCLKYSISTLRYLTLLLVILMLSKDQNA